MLTTQYTWLIHAKCLISPDLQEKRFPVISPSLMKIKADECIQGKKYVLVVVLSTLQWCEIGVDSSTVRLWRDIRTQRPPQEQRITSGKRGNNVYEKGKKPEKLGRTSYRKERIGTTDRLLGRYSFVVVVSADDEAFWDVIMMFIVRELWNGTHVSCCTTQWSCAIALFSSPRILNESCIQYSGVPELIKIPVALKFR